MTATPPPGDDGGGGDLVHVEPVMGTVVSFRLRPGPAGTAAPGAVAAACRRLHELDAVFSTWQPGSPVSRLRRGELTVAEAPAELARVLELCEEIRAASGGWFDPWAVPGGVDPTGMAKGWIVEQALAVVRAAGVGAALLNAGGDVAGFGGAGNGPWRVGIRHPWRADALACVVSLESAVATSGSYERGPHLVDPRRGEPVVACASATVCGPSLAWCDGLATALAVGGTDVLARIEALDGYEGYLIGLDGTERATAGMPFAPPQDDARDLGVPPGH